MKDFLHVLVFLVLILPCVDAFPQTLHKEHYVLLQEKSFDKEIFKKRKVSFLENKGQNVFVRYNPVSLVFGSLMFVYQKVFSEQFSSRCGYEISCSHFSKSVIKEYGLLKGVSLTADRLTRCTQFIVLDIELMEMSREEKFIDPPLKYRLKH